MNESELKVLTDELDDLQIALIFLNDATKHGFPALDNGIARIESAIDRFQARADMICLILAADSVAKSDKRDKERAV